MYVNRTTSFFFLTFFKKSKQKIGRYKALRPFFGTHADALSLECPRHHHTPLAISSFLAHRDEKATEYYSMRLIQLFIRKGNRLFILMQVHRSCWIGKITSMLFYNFHNFKIDFFFYPDVNIPIHSIHKIFDPDVQ